MTMRTVTLALLCGAVIPAAQSRPIRKNSRSRCRRWTNTSRKPRSRQRRIARFPRTALCGRHRLDLASDLRARRVDDIVTIVVDESASATSMHHQTSRTSSAQSNIAVFRRITPRIVITWFSELMLHVL